MKMRTALKKPRIGVVAVQGDFREHERMLEELGAATKELRNLADLGTPPDGLVLPGGESTAQSKLLRESGMLGPIKAWIEAGVPVLATCAGLILLAERVENRPVACFGTLPVTVRRNAYGRQLGSFVTEATVKGVGPMRLTFIRAPYVAATAPKVETLATVQGKTVAVRYENQLGLAFHPEVGNDTRLHQYFLAMCAGTNQASQPKIPLP